MTDTYWHKQTSDKPLFPDLLWSRPEHKASAGKLLIIGGNSFGFSGVANAYQIATKSGVGTTHVLLPDAIKKVVGPVMAEGEFTASTPSGSFSQKALSDLLDQSAWSDGVLLPGDLGRNSETAILLEKFLREHPGQATLAKDAADYALGLGDLLLRRRDTLLVITMAQLQKLAMIAASEQPVTFGMDLIHLVDYLHSLTTEYPLGVIVKHNQQLLCAHSGQVSTTQLKEDIEMWRIPVAASAAVWWLQNPTKPLEAFTTAVHDLVRFL